MIGEIIIIVLILWVLLSYRAYKKAQKEQEELKKKWKPIDMKIVIECDKCGCVIMGKFYQGNYVNMEVAPHIKCGGTYYVSAIYRDDKKYSDKDIELYRKWQTGGQNTW